MLREYRVDGSDNCWIPAGMDIITAGTPREWSANFVVKNFGVPGQNTKQISSVCRLMFLLLGTGTSCIKMDENMPLIDENQPLGTPNLIIIEPFTLCNDLKN